MPDKPTPAELLEWLLEAEEMDEPTFAEWLAEQSPGPDKEKPSAQ
jgi:hypothetical protein